MWHDRASAVRTGGTSSLLESTPGRWFGPGFTEEHPKVAQALLDALAAADDESYAALCEALGRFDVRDRLAEIDRPVLAVAGSHDVATPTAGLRHVAEGVQLGRLVELDGVGHLAPAERPEEVARLVSELAATPPAGPTSAAVRAAGMRVRREVLGDAHVDRASASATDFTAEFQAMITQYAWGNIWTRPGLDRRSRSLITLTALVARGHHDELAMHIRAARTNGLSPDEIKELLLQTAIYCGVPDANTAFRIAQQVLADLDDPDANAEQES
jgi:3-oxoadipate enol-lactonase/4-carboxymuconolactone decarboxylase